MPVPDPERIANDVAEAVRLWNAGTARGKDKAEHKIGVSDIGVCREYVRWMTVEQEPTDDPPNYKAFIGSWLGDGVEEAVAAVYPTARRNVEITVTLPSGASYVGHPDFVLPRGVLDIKTVDGLTGVRRHGPNFQQQIQRHLYCAGCIQAGLLDEADAWVGNIWFDRSGREETPHVSVESYDPGWLIRADEWLDDVIYAVKHGERAYQDMPLEWCQACCEFFTICRGEDVVRDRESQGLITDPFLLDYIEAYNEGNELVKQGTKMKDDSRRALAGISGTTGEHVVRWVYVNPSEVPGHTRAGYQKLDIRRIPKPKPRKK